MSKRLDPPENVSAVGKDGAVYLKWKPVFGADGYKIYFYSAYEPSKCIKTRYSQGTEKTVSGFVNNKGYLAEVRAFKNGRSYEIMGESSRRVPFSPMCEKLRAEGAVCLKIGESKQINCVCPNENASYNFVSENTEIAEVNSTGVVTGVSRGVCYVTITSSDGEKFRTKIVVERSFKLRSGRAELLFAGDIMCSGSQQRAVQKNLFDFSRSFNNIRGLIKKADFAVGVFNPICVDDLPYEFEQQRQSGVPVKNIAPTTFVSAVANAGFGAVVTSTDNCLCAGEEGLDRTVAEIKKAGMRNIGTCGDNPTVLDVKGIKVGIVACDMLSDGSKGDALFNKTGRYDREYFVELINTARAMGAEFIAAVVHWGTSNSHRIRQSQRDEAVFMAKSGADLIVGAHPHVVQKFEFIETEDGKKVPCAFSLGNFLSSMSELRENRDGAILRAELYKNENGVCADYSYIPCYCEDREYGVCTTAADPPHSEACRESFERTRAFMGKSIKTHPKKPLMMIFGSSNNYRILKAGNAFRVNKTAMLLSPLSLGAKRAYAVPEKCGETAAIDISKDVVGCIDKVNPDYAVVDFYSAAVISCFKDTAEESCYFTNIEDFRETEFYAKRRPDWVRIRPPFGESVWKPLVKEFAQKLLSRIPSERIILVRCCISSKRKMGFQLRTVSENERRNRFMREMEDYFIELVNPAVIDLADKYFVEENTFNIFEEDYYADAYKAAVEIVFGTGRTCVSGADAQSWFSRAMKYYESMSIRSYHSRLLDMNNAADIIVAQTSVDFCARNSERIIRLKKSGLSELSEVGTFFENDAAAGEIIRAAEIIDLVIKGNLSLPYDFYAPAFVGNYNIVQSIARQLAKEVGNHVDEHNAELVFMLRGKPQMARYLAALDRKVIDVWGSDVSRETINHCREAVVGKYIFMQAQILLNEKPLEIDVPSDAEQFCGNKWRRKAALDAFARNGIEFLEESSAHWIMVDFYDLICPMAEYKGTLFEIDDFIRRTDFYKSISKESAECYLFEKRDMKFCFDGITKFSNEILDLYGENIILIKTDPKNYAITQDFRLDLMKDELFAIKKKFIALCEERFASITKCYVIDVSKEFYSSDSYPFGGRHTVHYEEEFYRQAGEYVSDILKGTEKKVFNRVDENYILLRNLKLKRDR